MPAASRLALAGLGALAALAAQPLHAVPGAERFHPSLADLAFLSGAWRGDFRGSILEEHFTSPECGTIVGMFRWSREGRTTLTEHLVLEERDDGVHLFLRHFDPGLVPWSQEAGGAMHYRLASLAEHKAVFEDPGRSFPRSISYERTGPDSLVSRLDGHGEDGERRIMEFVYRSMVVSTTGTETLTAAGRALGYDGGLTIALQVKDLNKAIDFYENVVGFKIQYRLDDMGWCELTTSVPRVNIGLSQVEKPSPGGQTPTFGVKNIERARKILEERGARFDGETVEIPDMVKLATFYDPDGNPLMLYQSLSDQIP